MKKINLTEISFFFFRLHNCEQITIPIFWNSFDQLPLWNNSVRFLKELLATEWAAVPRLIFSEMLDNALLVEVMSWMALQLNYLVVLLEILDANSTFSVPGVNFGVIGLYLAYLFGRLRILLPTLDHVYIYYPEVTSIEYHQERMKNHLDSWFMNFDCHASVTFRTIHQNWRSKN